MNQASIQTRRDALAADMARNQANIARTKEEIGKAQEQLGYYDREFHTLNGAIQTCDNVLNDIREEESKCADGRANLREFRSGPGQTNDIGAIAKEVADREARVAAQG